jgi:hypothetical protein
MEDIYIITATSKHGLSFVVGASATLLEAQRIADHQKEFMKGLWELTVDRFVLGSYWEELGEMECEENVYKA